MITATNRFIKAFAAPQPLLSIYTPAGFPLLSSTEEVCRTLFQSGANMIEIGIPFSDPVADGPTIQKANTIAIENGVTLDSIFTAIRNIRGETEIPLVMMGHLNPLWQYGMEKFCQVAGECGVDGVIIPDMPPELYVSELKDLFQKNNLELIFLVTPQTTDERIRYLDSLGNSFLYAVSSTGVTGGSLESNPSNQEYLSRLRNLKLKNPFLVGFGIESKEQVAFVSQYARGAIIGSAFVRALGENSDSITVTKNFMKKFQ